MRTQLITNFNSIREWKSYCFNTHSSYLKNQHFREWINKKEIYIFNFSNLKNDSVKAITLGINNAIKIAKLHFKIKNSERFTFQANFSASEINSNKILKMIMEERKQNHKENANIFIFNNPIKSLSAIIKDGEALTYVSEGITIFSFDAFQKYHYNFLMRRAKHEALHLLGLNSHHEDTKVKGYKHKVICNMNYNAPTQRLCLKCKDGLISFWRGIEYATKKQFVKNHQS